MKSRDEVLRLVGKVGGEIRMESGEISIDAPTGFVWAGTGLHYVDHERWTTAVQDVKRGVERCQKPGCEICEDA